MFAGCGGLMKGLAAKMDPSAGDTTLVNDAATANKWDQVEAYCSSKFRKADGKKLHYKAKKVACDSHAAYLKENSEKSWKAATCKDIIPVWEQYKSTFQRQRGKMAGYHADASVRMGKCGHYAYVFKDLIHWGPLTHGAMGLKSLAAMDAAGLPVEKEFIKWMGAQTSPPWEPKYGHYAMGHYVSWREKKGGTIDCKPYVKVWGVLTGGEEVAWA